MGPFGTHFFYQQHPRPLPLAPSVFERFKRLPTEKEQFHYIVEHIAQTDTFHQSLKLPNAEHILKVRKQNTLALMNYVPHVYPGPITLLRSRENAERYPDHPDFGWEKIAAGGIRIYDVPMNHEDMFTSAHIEFVAELLKACLSEAQGSNSNKNSISSNREK
jgi:thioesterase domain-containing protein